MIGGSIRVDGPAGPGRRDIRIADQDSGLASNAQVDFQRRLEHLLEQIALIDLSGLARAHALSFLQQDDAVGKFRGEI